MMTSPNGNIFRVTGPLCGEFTGPGEFPTQRPVARSSDVFFDLRVNWVNNREAGDLRRHRGHYDVNVMYHIVVPIPHDMYLQHAVHKGHEGSKVNFFSLFYFPSGLVQAQSIDKKSTPYVTWTIPGREIW